MTPAGLAKLTAAKAELEHRLKEAGQRAGEAAGINRDWHDNAAYEYAVQDIQKLQTQLSDIDEQLRTAVMIEPPAERHAVAIGTSVTVEIEGEVETYFIGGEADSDPARGVISYMTPLAKALLGKHVGDDASLTTPSGETHIVRVTAIN